MYLINELAHKIKGLIRHSLPSLTVGSVDNCQAFQKKAQNTDVQDPALSKVRDCGEVGVTEIDLTGFTIRSGKGQTPSGFMCPIDYKTSL